MAYRFTLTLLVAAVVVLGLAAPGGTDTTPVGGQKVVVHLSHFSDDLHAVTMGLGIAAGMAKEGAAVTLMLDLEGPRLADSRQSLDMRWGHSQTVEELYGAFLAAGGTVLLCPHCAHHAGLTDEFVRDGARIAAEGELPKLILAADKVLDY